MIIPIIATVVTMIIGFMITIVYIQWKNTIRLLKAYSQLYPRILDIMKGEDDAKV